MGCQDMTWFRLWSSKSKVIPVLTMKAYVGNGCTAVLIVNLSTRWRCRHPHTSARGTQQSLSRTLVAPEPVMTFWGGKNLWPLTGIKHLIIQPIVLVIKNFVSATK